MSRNYDNWERLVVAVLRRENDRQIALSHSRNSSTISSTSSSFDHSFSYASLLDPDDHSLSDYFKLTLDHEDWKMMLPPYKQEVVLKSASLRFYLEEKNGKNCFLIGSQNLGLTSMEGLGGRWDSKPHPESRFSEVVELVNSWEINIHGWIKANMLSPKTVYGAYLVFGFHNKYQKLQAAKSLIRIVKNGFTHLCREQVSTVYFATCNVRADEWMEIKLGDFYVGMGGNQEVHVHLIGTKGFRQGGIIIEGIEFRPLVDWSSTVTRRKGLYSNSRIS